MKDWELEAALAALDPFAPETANYELEQYSTSAHLAAQIVLCAARSFGDVEGQVVLDLGCGTAASTRGLRAAFPEADVLAYDTSPPFLRTARLPAAPAPSARPVWSPGSLGKERGLFRRLTACCWCR